MILYCITIYHVCVYVVLWMNIVDGSTTSTDRIGNQPYCSVYTLHIIFCASVHYTAATIANRQNIPCRLRFINRRIEY